ncbi:MAG: hypothetical protein A3H52_01500 [Candidatus Zambryskibacteria bacterium RIFCSPLOWO2_02_FULL_39_26]|uniref:TVP38/TMEM64 family membrane protein n=1 Tax=Candidatus Zambryskibacteria bacterium RIFCSPLOWO2_12_FULL_39_23 TaxID=1802776 RepID=A0A1G2URH7_9BACT|nr:MAG: hypothetical protein A2W51_00955 [Candidatus Zambryskibacteria bacterium RIFCSPHIGHO2_02_39_10]OHA99297.1 MAG: hypothetical protein A3E59_00250 [Candidatus Zambryskibacteria bacterium RIFCSPHIGHO2_12_FULL_39_47]OHB10426.1 MAG: hypothetical protein A3H52_01500 [Candidatus Zambryskibacteria bacterium RIFCSPLOWO2_02_FULL_39_26]OHB11997.1 MAG: hypothetical protein A3G99_02845 [Candidatus Zambryskibacteria bacterium RIFCSPLOWO2_12_FULL_39_23]
MKPHNRDGFLMQDISIIVISVLIAFVLVETDTISRILDTTVELKLLGSFIAGIFFTSIFTTVPAIVTLGELAKINTVVPTALFGALGAVLGDLIIFKFIRDRLSEHLVELLKHDSSWKRIKTLFRLRYFKWLTFFLGGIILASPFPDELAISLFGVSKIKVPLFIAVSFIFNFIGIFIIGTLARSF